LAVFCAGESRTSLVCGQQQKYSSYKIHWTEVQWCFVSDSTVIWQFFVLGKAEHPLYVASNRSIPVTKYTGLKCSCVLCQTVQLFSLYAVRAQNKCDFRLAMNPTNGGQYKGHAMTQTHNFDRIYVYPPPPPPRPPLRVLMDSTRVVQVSYILLSKGQYFVLRTGTLMPSATKPQLSYALFEFLVIPVLCKMSCVVATIVPDVSKALCCSVFLVPSGYCTCTSGEQFKTASRTANAPVPKRYPIQPPKIVTGIPEHCLKYLYTA
jgi:hypothetical protein